MRECSLQNLLYSAEALIGNQVFAHSFWRDGQSNLDIVEGGAKSCAFALSSLLVWFEPNHRRLCRVRHTTVQGFLVDIAECRWQKMSRDAIPYIGDVLHWEERRGNEHVGLYIGNQLAISTDRRTGCLAKHRWDHEADESAPRAVVGIWRHSALLDQIPNLVRSSP